MALIDDAVLLMIPSGYKAGTLYNVLPNTAAGDFTVANAGTKFRTNSDLMLEEIAANTPALDYDAVGGCPHVKLNEANTNLLERPLSFDNAYWTKSGATVTGGHSSPSVTYPTDAYKLVESVDDEQHKILIAGSINVTDATPYNLSWFVKADGKTKVALRESHGANKYASFNLSTGVLIESNATSESITALSDGWYRIEMTVTSVTRYSPSLYLLPDTYTTGNPNTIATEAGDGTSGVYLAFAQLSAKSYAPTFTYSGEEGAQSSMLADAITDGGDAALFASVNASGVLYFEGSFNTTTPVGQYISFSDGSNDNRIQIDSYIAGFLRVRIYTDGDEAYNQNLNIGNLTNNIKIAISWEKDEFKVYINGMLKGTIITVGNTFPTNTTLNVLNFATVEGDSPFYGNTKQVAVFNYLTDAQMIELTTP